MRLAITSTGEYAVRRCADALSDIQLRLLSLADGARDTDDLIRECIGCCDPSHVQQALGDLLDLELIAPLLCVRDTRPKPRRSPAAAKMYLVAIFERMRRGRASQIRDALLAARNDHDLLEAIHDAIPFLEAHASRGFAAHVMAELQILLPQQHAESIDVLMARTLREHNRRESAPAPTLRTT